MTHAYSYNVRLISSMYVRIYIWHTVYIDYILCVNKYNVRNLKIYLHLFSCGSPMWRPRLHLPMACSIQSTRRPRTCGPAPHHSWVLPAPMIPMPKGKHRETIEMTIFKAVLFYTVFQIWYLKTLSFKADIVARKKHWRCAIWLSMGFI